MQLGIFAPYNFSEATTAAVHLASVAMSMDMNVSYLATQERADNVHDYWDSRVRSNPKKHFKEWAKNSDKCVWFTPSRRRFEQALGYRSNATHILVPPWHQLDEIDMRWLHWYDHVVCPSPEARFRVQEISGHMEFSASDCSWASGLVFSPRDDVWVPGRISFFMPIGTLTQKKHAGEILRFIELLLGNNPNASLTVVPSRSWTKEQKKRIGQLLGMFNERLRIAEGINLTERLQVARSHDCALLLDTQINIGVDATRYRTVGLPVVAWDAEPTNSMVEDEINGLLLKSHRDIALWGAERMAWDVTLAAGACTRLCQDPKRLTALMGGNVYLKETEEEFRQTWSGLINPTNVS